MQKNTRFTLKLIYGYRGRLWNFCEQVKKREYLKRLLRLNLIQAPLSPAVKGVYPLLRILLKIYLYKKVDVITSIESIEHVFDPKKYIKGIYDKLHDGGLLFIATPNIKGFDLLVLKDKSDNTTAPDHLNYFHPKSISLLLGKVWL